MKKTQIPSQAELHELLEYDPISGKLFWKTRPIEKFQAPRIGRTWNTRFAGKEALSALRKDGYLGGAINYTNYLAHRVIFKMLHGYDPDQVDHDNRNRTDNRPHNLIDGSATDNSRNCKLYRNNSSGFVGVHWDKSRHKWVAAITVAGKMKHLGRFEDINDALEARQKAEQHHNFHPNHGT